MNDPRDLPAGWCVASLGDVVDVHDARRVPVNAEERATRPGPYPYFGANGQVDTIDDYLFEGDFVLVAEDGGHFDDPSRGVAYRATGRFWVNNHAHVLEPKGGIPVELMVHALNSVSWMAHVSGTTRPKLTQGAMVRVPIRLPPLAEQRRILTKLDAAKAHSRRAREALAEVPALLEKLRQSILAAAFRGDLTRGWRDESPDVEPAERLLQRIRSERRKKWEEAELARMDAKGKLPTDDRWKEKYREPARATTNELPALPECWCWASGDELFELVTSGSRGWAEHYSSDGPLFIRIGNLSHASIDLDLRQRQHVRPPAGAEGERTRLRAADILVSITADLGMVAIVPTGTGEAYINQHIALARPVEPRIAHYVASYLSAPEAGKKHLLRANRGMTKAGLGLDDIRAVPIPLAPLEECGLISEVVRRRLSAVSRARSEASSFGAELDRLDAACLSKAFRGELVPQDPNDEPADVMLARLKASTAAVASPTNGKRKGRPREP